MRCWLSALVMCASLVACTPSGPGDRYNEDNRGTYRGSYYVVNKGDTLYYIAYLTNKDINQIIALNHLSPPYTIQPGQKLKLWSASYRPAPYAGTGSGDTPKVENSSSSVAKTAAVAGAAVPAVATPSPSAPTSSSKTKVVPESTNSSKQTVAQVTSKGYVEKQASNNSAKTTSPVNASVTSWSWPTRGRVVERFSSGDQGNKGIDIAGQRGQSIVSTADGSVVYSGSALRGYGNLVIVKHNDNYLSAYAHNDTLLVKEGQSVKAGQKIATMGSSGRTDVRLHFEIRYQGKSVDPMRYLP